MTDAHLLMLRHAKAAWPAGVPDLERPLARRGEADAGAVGAALAAGGVVPDLVLVSPALRTRTTWELAARAAGLGDVPVEVDRNLYEATVEDVVRAVREVDPAVATLLVVGHQPTTSAVVSHLADGASDEDALDAVRTHYPTAGLAELGVPGPWADLDAGRAVLRSFSVPRAT